jgi:hypothetical protein
MAEEEVTRMCELLDALEEAIKAVPFRIVNRGGSLRPLPRLFRLVARV